VRRGIRVRTELGNAYFAQEDETPFHIGQKLHVYGNQLVALNNWHLPGLKLRSKLREAGPGRCCLSRHHVRFRPSFIELFVIA